MSVQVYDSIKLAKFITWAKNSGAANALGEYGVRALRDKIDTTFDTNKHEQIRFSSRRMMSSYAEDVRMTPEQAAECLIGSFNFGTASDSTYWASLYDKLKVLEPKAPVYSKEKDSERFW